MKLYEFFNVPKDEKGKSKGQFPGQTDTEKEKIADEVFWFIIDHDELHKEFVLPFARDLENQLGSPNFNRERFTKQWIPMVNKGCQLYYKKNKLKDDPAEIFNKELRKGICEKLSEKFMDEISNNSYRIGKHTK